MANPFALNRRQAAFVRELTTKPITLAQAARNAGYSKETAQVPAKLLERPAVKAALTAADADVAGLEWLTPQFVLGGIRDLTEKCSKEGVYYDKEGNIVRDADGDPIKRPFNGNVAMRGYELLGKNKRLFIDRVEVNDGSELSTKIKRARERVGLTIDSETHELIR